MIQHRSQQSFRCNYRSGGDFCWVFIGLGDLKARKTSKSSGTIIDHMLYSAFGNTSGTIIQGMIFIQRPWARTQLVENNGLDPYFACLLSLKGRTPSKQ